jgi:hypothetical protein
MINQGLLKNIGECLSCKQPIYQDKDGKVYFSCECMKKKYVEAKWKETNQNDKSNNTG